MKIFALSLFALFAVGCGINTVEKDFYDSLTIEVSGESREYFFTNKKYGQFYGETNSDYLSGWQGWTLREKRIFNDYEIFFNDKKLDRNFARVKVSPHLLKREYENIFETLFFPDGIDALFLEAESKTAGKFLFAFKNIFTDSAPFANENSVTVDLQKVLPGYNLIFASNTPIDSAGLFEGKLNIYLRDTDKPLLKLSVREKAYTDFSMGNLDSLKIAKKNRIKKLLADSFVKTDLENFNKALAWAKISLDALVAEQDMKGIFAGLPWFNNFWGRDVFISLPGAAFTQNNFEDAETILLSFAERQDRNPRSEYFGRIPNRITLTESIYNTVDGTPRFIIEAYKYFKYSADTAFLKKIFPAAKTALDGALKTSVDNFGFLTHADAETWMDAVGPKGPWSPRGNRAVDIQALWHGQLKATKEMAKIFSDSIIVEKCDAVLTKLKENFEKHFLNPSKNLLYDHIRKNGEPDSSIRPNLFVALNNLDLFSETRNRVRILANAMDKLVYPYGVLSLSYEDENFHPFHEYPPFYPKDAAYHNGIIWQWNFGPTIQSLCGSNLADTAWVLTKNLTDEILNKGAVGTIAELKEAFPRPGKDNILLSGTGTQAWSIAEYIRNFYQDYLGIFPDAPKNSLYLLPSLPSSIKDVEVLQKIGNNTIKIRYQFTNDVYRVYLDGENLTNKLNVGVSLVNKANANYQLMIAVNKGDKIFFEIPTYSNSIKDLHTLRNDVQIEVPAELLNESPENLNLYKQIKFARPIFNPNWKSIKKPDYSLLTNEEIKLPDDKANEIISEIDPTNDEALIYPRNYLFKNGILDLTNFKIKEDENNYYFDLKFGDLVDPGWHREYGFQLTFVSVCVKNSSAEKSSREVGLNSNYSLPSSRSFNRQINIGGGIEIKDASGKILAAYIPQKEDINNPLGSVDSKTISFSVPKKYIGVIDKKTIISILVGAQDDHGGAGIGEFRNALVAPGEWHGGGSSQRGSNVYDKLFIN